jgi:leucyl aminopeptidase
MIHFELKTGNLLDVSSEKCDALIVLVTQDFKPGKDDIAQVLAQSIKAGDFEAAPGKLLTLYRSALVQAPRLVLAGVGEGTDKNVRIALLAAVAAVKGNGLKKLLVCFAAPAQEAAIRAAVLVVADATYSYTHTKSKKEERTLQKVVLYCSNASEVQSTFERAAATVPGIEMAKEWANRPANYATPTLLGEAALELAKLPKIRCEVLDVEAVTKLGMGAFMAVAQGSDQPLRFIVLRYDGAAKSKAPHVLVGKGITFDSGGISIKPAAEMDEMKFDMSGAASVLGVFRALSNIKPAINVVGLIPACENLPNGRAVKPGDVITSMSGQTIEVLNTDAEGRLVLCDALTYAERFKPAAVIDIATLTGACVIALGAVRSGMFSPHAELARSLIQAGEAAQDLCWQMPLDDEYAEGLKTNFADVANVAGRPAGSVTAAKFLQRFTEKYPWAHLDIAGTAWKGGTAKGATGRPVGLLVEYLIAQANAK